MKEIKIEISAVNQDELEIALEEVLRQVKKGVNTMDDQREDGTSSITMTGGGMEENVPREEEVETLKTLGYNIEETGQPLTLNGAAIINSEPHSIDYPDLAFSRAEAAKIHLLFKVRKALSALDEKVEEILEDDYDDMSVGDQNLIDSLNELLTSTIDYIDTYPDKDGLRLDEIEAMVTNINEYIKMGDYIDQDASTQLTALFSSHAPSMSM